MFFDLHSQGRLDGRHATLLDSNVDLIGCYLALRDTPQDVIRDLRRLAQGHRRHGARQYYRVRDERFNPLRRQWRLEHGADAPWASPLLAAMLVYLNRTGFNGLFRLSAGGDFNVPAGRYTNPVICDARHIRQVAAALARPEITIACAPFGQVLDWARPGDFLYLDPPYAPLSPTARFTNYTQGGFSSDDQARLQEVVIELATRGCRVLLSNSTAPIVSRLYVRNLAARGAGLKAYRVPARRAINANAARRGAVLEYIITNVRPVEPGAQA